MAPAITSVDYDRIMHLLAGGGAGELEDAWLLECQDAVAFLENAVGMDASSGNVPAGR